MVDAGPGDSGPADSGPSDSGPGDSGPIDSGPADSGPVDSGPPDSGPLDSGPADNEQSPYRNLDVITPGLYLMVVNGTMALYNELYASTDPTLYRRCDPTNTSLGMPEQKSGFRFCVDSARTPFPLDDQGQEYLPWSWDGWTTQQYSFWGAQTAAALGADATRVQAWSAWNELVWPQ